MSLCIISVPLSSHPIRTTHQLTVPSLAAVIAGLLLAKARVVITTLPTYGVDVLLLLQPLRSFIVSYLKDANRFRTDCTYSIITTLVWDFDKTTSGCPPASLRSRRSLRCDWLCYSKLVLIPCTDWLRPTLVYCFIAPYFTHTVLLENQFP